MFGHFGFRFVSDKKACFVPGRCIKKTRILVKSLINNKFASSKDYISVNRTRNDDFSPRGCVKFFQSRNPKEKCYVCRANLHQRSWARPACVVIIWFLGGKEKKKPTAVAERGARVCIAPCHCVVLVRWQASCWPAGMSSRGVRAVYFRACLCSYLVSLYRPEAGHRHYAN